MKQVSGAAMLTARLRVLRTVAGVVLIGLAVLMAACGVSPAAPANAPEPSASPRSTRTIRPTPTPMPSETSTPASTATSTPAATPVPPTPVPPTPAGPFVPAPLFVPGLDLSAAAVVVPLELRIPSLKVVAPMLGVGLNRANGMDAPEGPANDPNWQKVFWYRGSAIPGEASTATIAGHVDDILGRPAVFARINTLRSGDFIIIHDTRNGLDVRFVVKSTIVYTVQQAETPAVLAQVYGSGPVAGRVPQPEPDGLSHLTLITCGGAFINGSYDRRLVVYAVRG